MPKAVLDRQLALHRIRQAFGRRVAYCINDPDEAWRQRDREDRKRRRHRPAAERDGQSIAAAGEALLAPSVTRRLIEAFARLRPSAPPPTGLDELTPRELEVLSLLGRGLSNAEIAAALAVESSTVKTHVHSILNKLDLRDRAQAVVAAYESGLVEPGAETHKH